MLRSMFGSCPRAAQEHSVNYTFQRAAQEQLKVFNERSRGSLLMMTLMAMMRGGCRLMCGTGAIQKQLHFEE
jgi:hypothetical protein